jgi:hypothetical protein
VAGATVNNLRKDLKFQFQQNQNKTNKQYFKTKQKK